MLLKINSPQLYLDLNAKPPAPREMQRSPTCEIVKLGAARDAATIRIKRLPGDVVDEPLMPAANN